MELAQRENTPMPNKAKAYIASTITVGLTMLAAGLLQWHSPNPARYFTYLLLALFASTRKIQLPKITGTISVSFLFILIGVAQFTLSETILLSCTAALIQCLWKPKRQPKPEQIFFNMGALSVSTAVAYWGSHFALDTTRTSSLIILLAVAAYLFFLTNTALVAIVISLTEERPLKDVWQQCYAGAFPLYLVGAPLSGLISASMRSVSWSVSLLILPAMYLMYLYYRFHLENAAQERMHLDAEELENEVALSSREV